MTNAEAFEHLRTIGKTQGIPQLETFATCFEQALQEANEALDISLATTKGYRNAVTRLRNEIAELRDALKPFADLATDKCWLSVRPDDFGVFDDGKRHKITVGDLRRARAVLEGKG